MLMLRRRRGLLRVRLLEMVVREERHGEGEVRRQERTEPPRGKGAGQREREREREREMGLLGANGKM